MVEGTWPLYVSLVGRVFAGEVFCPAPCPTQTFSQTGIFGLLFPGLGVLLVVVGAIGIWGARVSFLIGTGASALLLAVAGWAYLSDSGAIGLGSPYTDHAVVVLDEIVATLLCILGTAANFVATRKRGRLPEQVNPMNLPVFG